MKKISTIQELRELKRGESAVYHTGHLAKARMDTPSLDEFCKHLDGYTKKTDKVDGRISSVIGGKYTTMQKPNDYQPIKLTRAFDYIVKRNN